jgi:cytochrome d ubiquinol oxidase subunit II
MAAVWFAIIAGMLTAWTVLDGLDFGAGLVHFVVAKTERERATVLAAIGPIWDGNEVWLVASGGVFVFAFPRAYAAAFSGMYLPLMMVLWLLVLRGIAIEFRGQLRDILWRQGWDFVFSTASALIAFVAGVALGNVLRGVPLDATGRFHLDLFSLDVRHGAAIDFYTSLVGVTATAVLTGHGALYLAWKTGEDVHRRSVVTAKWAWPVAMIIAAAATVSTALVHPAMAATLAGRPWAWPLPVGAAGCSFLVMRSLRRGDVRTAFIASSGFIALLLLATAAALFPVLIASTVGRQFDIDAWSAASGDTGLAIGLAWWLPAIALAIAYFVHLFRSMRGKVSGDYGH